jgi:hypothetical protein
LITTLLATGSLVPAAEAAVVTSEAALASTAAGDADRTRVADFLARADVARQLESLGVDAGQARERVALLTDEEASQIAGKLDELPAGGGAGLAVAIVALVIVIVLLLELMGVIDIFTGIGPRR